jgi:ferredoxin
MTEIFSIDKRQCLGSGLCAHEVPEVFAIDEDGNGVVIAQPTEETIEAARKSALWCPAEAINITET